MHLKVDLLLAQIIGKLYIPNHSENFQTSKECACRFQEIVHIMCHNGIKLSKCPHLSVMVLLDWNTQVLLVVHKIYGPFVSFFPLHTKSYSPPPVVMKALRIVKTWWHPFLCYASNTIVITKFPKQNSSLKICLLRTTSE